MNTIIKDIVISINIITLIYIMFQYKDTCMKREKNNNCRVVVERHLQNPYVRKRYLQYP